MSDETKTPDDGEEGSVPSQPGEVRLRPVQQVTVSHLKEAAPSPAEKVIHPRRPLPIIPKKPEQDTEEIGPDPTVE